MAEISAAAAYSELRAIHEASRRMLNCINDWRKHYKRVPAKDRAMADCTRYLYSAARQVLYHAKLLHERWPSTADVALPWPSHKTRNPAEDLAKAIDELDEEVRALAEGNVDGDCSGSGTEGKSGS